MSELIKAIKFMCGLFIFTDWQVYRNIKWQTIVSRGILESGKVGSRKLGLTYELKEFFDRVSVLLVVFLDLLANLGLPLLFDSFFVSDMHTLRELFLDLGALFTRHLTR